MNWLLFLALTLPTGLSPDHSISMARDISYLGAEMPVEAMPGQRVSIKAFFDVPEVPGDDVYIFLHLEDDDRPGCRVNHDRPLKTTGLVAYESDIVIPKRCTPGHMVAYVGLYHRRSGQRIAIHGPHDDHRIDAGDLTLVAQSPRRARRVWSPSAVLEQRSLEGRHEWWHALMGLLLAVLALYFARRRMSVFSFFALRHPRLSDALQPLRWLEVAVIGALYIGAAVFTWQYFDIAWRTINHPYQLEWMEGGIIETIDRIRQGQPIYTPPTVEYVPYIYAPFYFVVSALSSVFFGVDLFAARLVSFLSSLGCGALVFLFIRCEGFTRWAFVGAGFFFATFNITGRWFHLARVDSLYVFLLLLSFYVLRFYSGRRSAIVAGILMWLCWLTKQSAPLALIPVGVALLVIDRRRILIAGVLATALTTITTLVLNGLTDGWFLYYLLDLPGQHEIVDDNIKDFWIKDLWRIPLAFGLATLAIGVMAYRDARGAIFYAGLFVGCLATSWASRLHSGGVINVIIPSVAAIAILMPLALAQLEQRLASGERKKFGGSPTIVMIGLMVAFQFLALDYAARDAIPQENQVARGDNFIAYLARIEGEVLLPDHRFLQTRAGKVSFGLGMASRDLLRSIDPDDRGREALEKSLVEAFESRRFSAVILSEERHLRHFLMPHYCFSERIHLAPMPNTGWGIVPSWVWVPRPEGYPETKVDCPQQAQADQTGRRSSPSPRSASRP